MLDTSTKKRIDDCRDILVGKLPDPKAQIEQITIGLIYKFMDDMDKEAIELGGSAKFFSGDYEKYAWDKLFDTKVTAAEMLRLYSDAIESMEKNPNIPQLFRDIFNNAYLPYRDPETLKLFLKTIGEFEYTHSEKLGDAFEYLLSVMGSQGDAGQFRTPRHIIDFLVAIIDPDKGETILDPACGTAGFLISAYKHILLKHTKANKEGLNIFEYNKLSNLPEGKTGKPFNNLGDQLTPDDRKKLIQNFAGYDISPDMVRLSLVNLYLHGFSDPHINEYDTLSSEDRWNENFDVVLANPPFMSPKGGIRPHKKFTISSNRSEVLFVDYIAEHLNPKGKAGIIVPEGVIFQSGTAYKALRKMLVEDYLYAVVSLPAGVFNPYSGVKTSILLMDKAIAKQRNEILFVKIDNDGYNLGAQRAAVKGGQLKEAIALTHEFVASGEISDSLIAHAVLKTEIAANGDYNLSGERYKSKLVADSNFEMVDLSNEEIFKILSGGTPSSSVDEYWNGDINWATLIDLPQSEFISVIYSTERKITEEGLKNSSAKMLPINSVIVSTRATIGRIAINAAECSTNQGFKNIIIEDFSKANTYFVALMMTRLIDRMNAMATGGTFKELSTSNFKTLQIPLPPLSIQEEIVAEIEGYQKIINGAKAVVANYKPKIDIDPDWEMVELETIAQVISGYGFNSSDFSDDNPIRCIKITNVGVREFVDDDSSRLPEHFIEEYSRYAVNTGDLVISLTRTIISSGLKVAVVPESWDNTLVNQRVAGLKPMKDSNIQFLYHYLCSDSVYKYVEEQSRSLMQPNLSVTDLKKLPVPNPPIDIQNGIVQQIQIEQELVNSNKKLIEIFEQKITERIAKVWGE
ncbi:N-6 DNA methylase [Namhaeicola litoreus]|uniref:site-specific DNA-methyltransferase (adenine-specific) n=1 Tax=Namhaeicola litoreus TaxID=1052145 RepID=A0ABW3XXF8_9FLAO